MDSHAKPTANQVLPPWLWFWLVTYLLSVPTQVNLIWMPILGDVFSRQSHPGGALSPFSFFFRFANFAELAPLLLVALGVITIFTPRRRIRHIQQAYGLTVPPDIPVVKEISEFLSNYAPGIAMRANLLRTDQLAFIYPLNYRTTAIALFGGIVKLWRQDRQAAEAILLHEIAHYRQGDALVIRAGNFFVMLLNIWLPLVICLVALPMMFVWGYDAVLFVFSNDTSLGITATIGHKINQLFTLFLPGLLLMILGILCWTASILSLPLLGIWCAELNADRFAINVQQSSDGLLRGVAILNQPTSWGNWLMFQMSHPPNKMRKWLALQAPKPIGLSLPLLLFPLAYLAKLIFLLAREISANLMYKSGAEIAKSLANSAEIYLQGIANIWLAMIILLLVWPWLSKYWEQFFCQSRIKSLGANHNKNYIIGAISLAGSWIILNLFF
jgi:Zn-dependent protease with chaperone function